MMDEGDVLACAGCGGDPAREPVRDFGVTSSRRWCGGMLTMKVDGEWRYVHHDDECVEVASLLL